MLTPTRRRWIPRFGLRMLLIIVTVICVILGASVSWYHAQEEEHRRQDRLCDELLEIGASVSWKSEAPPIFTRWFSGQKAFQRIWRITLARPRPEALQKSIEIASSLPTLNVFHVMYYQEPAARIAPRLHELSKTNPNLQLQIDDIPAWINE